MVIYISGKMKSEPRGAWARLLEVHYTDGRRQICSTKPCRKTSRQGFFACSFLQVQDCHRGILEQASTCLFRAEDQSERSTRIPVHLCRALYLFDPVRRLSPPPRMTKAACHFPSQMKGSGFLFRSRPVRWAALLILPRIFRSPTVWKGPIPAARLARFLFSVMPPPSDLHRRREPA